jgi:hypothetical protein
MILAVLLWRAKLERSAHFTATAVVALLGTANLAFWQVFIAMDALVMGYVTTALHWTFVALNLGAALTVQRLAEAKQRGAEASALRSPVGRTL